MSRLVSSLPHDPESACVDRSGLSGGVTVSASPYPKLEISGIDPKTTKALAIVGVGLFALAFFAQD